MFPLFKIHNTKATSRIWIIQILVESRKIKVILPFFLLSCQHNEYTGCPKKKYPNLVDPSDKYIAWIKPKWFSKHTSIANLNIDTSFVDIGALRVKILIFKGEICLHLQTRALALWPKGILEALWIKSTKSEDGTTDGFYKIQFMWDRLPRELRNQLHSSQCRQIILHILFTSESTPLSINTLLKSSNHSLKRIVY